jgi:hypothetical protein
MKANKQNSQNMQNLQHTPNEMRNQIMTMWETNRKTIIKTAAVVAVTGVVLTAFFLGRTRILSALKNSKLYSSGLELTHMIADTAEAATHKVMDAVGSVAHRLTDHSGVSQLN